MKICSGCGKELADNVTMCPDCGTVSSSGSAEQNGDAIKDFVANRRPSKLSKICLISLILGFGSLFFCFFFSVPGLAIVLGIIGVKECDNKGYGGRAMGIGGVVFGILSIIIYIGIYIKTGTFTFFF